MVNHGFSIFFDLWFYNFSLCIHVHLIYYQCSYTRIYFTQFTFLNSNWIQWFPLYFGYNIVSRSSVRYEQEIFRNLWKNDSTFLRDIFNNALSKELYDTSRFIYFPHSYTKYFIKFEKMSTSSQMKGHIFQLITYATFVQKFASYDDTDTKFSSIQEIETHYSNDATPLKGNHHYWTGLTVKKSR